MSSFGFFFFFFIDFLFCVIVGDFKVVPSEQNVFLAPRVHWSKASNFVRMDSAI